MFLFPRKSRSHTSRKQRSIRRPFRPFLELLEDRLTPDGSYMVNNVADLQHAIALANDNKAGAFTIDINPNASGYTLSEALVLNNANPGTTIKIEKTPGTTGEVILNGNNATRVLQVAANTNAIIDNVTIENGRAIDDPTNTGGAAGGGLLNMGGKVSLNQVNFTSNSADAPTGKDALGGAIFSVGGMLAFDTVTLSNNWARGGAGAAGMNGGQAFGGAISEKNTDIIVTNVPYAPGISPSILDPTFDPSNLSKPLLTVTGNTALGGHGADGTLNAGAGTNGGAAFGGGLHMAGGTIDLAVVSFSGNTAEGGNGGKGVTDKNGVGGAGGYGGDASGGAVETRVNTVIHVQKSSFTGNSALGGEGNLGGNSTAANTAGGKGGNGGRGIGGAFEIVAPQAQLFLSNSTVANNTANGGAGGNGGLGNAGSIGGDGGYAIGGGLDVNSTLTSLLLNDTIALNTINSNTSSGRPGSGGSGGANGKEGTATGGGINSVNGSAVLKNSVVANNALVNGDQTNGGPDVSGKIGTDTTFSYFGNPNGANLLKDLFNTATNTPLGHNLFGGLKDAAGDLVPKGQDVGLAAQLAIPTGGLTPALALNSGSFLIHHGDAGNTASALDQNGASRSKSQDLGAAQFIAASSSSPSINATLSPTEWVYSTSDQQESISATVSINGTNVTGGTVSFALVQNGIVVPGTATQAVKVAADGTVKDVKLTVPGGMKPGTYSLQATYTDDSGHEYSAQAVPAASLTIKAVATSLTPSVISATAQGVAVSASVAAANGGAAVPEGAVTFTLTNSSGVVVASQSMNVNSSGMVGPVTLGSNLPPGTYTVTASYSNSLGSGVYEDSSSQPMTATIEAPVTPPAPPPPAPWTPPSLNVPPLLAFFNAFLGATQSVDYANQTVTMVAHWFFLPLLVSTFDSVGHLTSVKLFGMFDVTGFFA